MFGFPAGLLHVILFVIFFSHKFIIYTPGDKKRKETGTLQTQFCCCCPLQLLWFHFTACRISMCNPYTHTTIFSPFLFWLVICNDFSNFFLRVGFKVLLNVCYSLSFFSICFVNFSKKYSIISPTLKKKHFPFYLPIHNNYISNNKMNKNLIYSTQPF